MQQPVESIFSRAWELLTKNPILLVPGIAIGAIGALLVFAIAGASAATMPQTPTGADFLVRLPSIALSLVIGVVIYVAVQAYTVGMAGAAWERGTTTLADGAAAFREDFGRIIVTSIGLIFVFLVAAIVALPTLFLSIPAAAIFTLYAMPAAVVGHRDGFSSIGESFRIAKRRFVPTLILVVLIFAVYFAASLLTLPLHFIPFLGTLVAVVLQQAVQAYVVLCIVGEYLNLRSSADLAGPPAV